MAERGVHFKNDEAERRYNAMTPMERLAWEAEMDAHLERIRREARTEGEGDYLHDVRAERGPDGLPQITFVYGDGKEAE